MYVYIQGPSRWLHLTYPLLFWGGGWGRFMYIQPLLLSKPHIFVSHMLLNRKKYTKHWSMRLCCGSFVVGLSQ